MDENKEKGGTELSEVVSELILCKRCFEEGIYRGTKCIFSISKTI